MANYSYYVDRKTTVWEREHHVIEANSQEEADLQARLLVDSNSENHDESFIKQETVYDTSEIMSIFENNGFAVNEVYSANTGELLIDDGDEVTREEYYQKLKEK